MHDFLIALIFIAIVASPAIIATISGRNAGDDA